MSEIPNVWFVDSNNVEWRVSERDTRADTGAVGDRCLIFDSGVTLRRVWKYPAEWRELSPEALSALSLTR